MILVSPAIAERAVFFRILERIDASQAYTALRPPSISDPSIYDDNDDDSCVEDDFAYSVPFVPPPDGSTPLPAFAMTTLAHREPIHSLTSF